jgi:type IV pilus assembly protein PilA
VDAFSPGGGIGKSPPPDIFSLTSAIKLSQRRLMILKNNRAFTLIELMIVIAIIGILAAIAIPQFSAYRQRAYVSALKSDANTIANAQEAYYYDHSTYAGISANLLVATYGVKLSPYTTLNDWNGDATSFSFACTDNIHGVAVTYRSAAGGLQ